MFGVAGPEISEQYVVWADIRTGNHDVYAYDLASRQEFAVATSSDTEASPVLSGNFLAWKRFIRKVDGPEGRYVPVIEYTELSKPANKKS